MNVPYASTLCQLPFEAARAQVPFLMQVMLNWMAYSGCGVSPIGKGPLANYFSET